MKYCLIGVLFCCLPFTTFAQPDSAKTWQMRWSVTSLLDPRAPVLQVGLQKHITPRWAVSAEYGLSAYGLFGNKNKWYGDTVREDYRYQKFRAELKHLSPLRNSAIDENLRYQLYLGVEGLFIPERYHKQTDYFRRNNERYDYYFSRVKSNIYVACLKGGMEWRYKQKWALDTYAGLGPRFIQVQHYDTVLNYDAYNRGGLFLFSNFITYRDRREGWYTTLHLTAGVKLGYYIW